jgi:hypothetical protein
VTKRPALSKRACRSWFAVLAACRKRPKTLTTLNHNFATSSTSNAGFFVLALALIIICECSASAFAVASPQLASRLTWHIAERRSFADLRRAALSCQACSLSTCIKDSIASGCEPSQQDVGSELRPGAVCCPFRPFVVVTCQVLAARNGSGRRCNFAHVRRNVPYALVSRHKHPATTQRTHAHSPLFVSTNEKSAKVFVKSRFSLKSAWKFSLT